MIALKPMPHTEACKFIADKPVVSRQVFDELLPEFRAKAFVITGVEDFDLVQTIKTRLAGLPAGGDYDKAVEEIEKDLAPWLGKAAERRAELLVRWHGFQAYATAQDNAIQRQADIFPHCMYVSSEDSRVRPGHAALDRIVAPSNSPFWNNHTPPWEPLCRCDKIPLTHDDVDTMKQEDAHLPPTRRRVLEGPLLSNLEQSDIVHGEIAMVNGQEHFLRGPGQDHLKGSPRSEGVPPGPMRWSPNDIRLTPQQILGRYDAAVARQFTDWAQQQPVDGKGTSVWDWMNGAKVHKSQPPGWPVQPKTPRAPKAKSAPAAPVSASTPLTYAAGMRDAITQASYTRSAPMGSGINQSVKLGNGIEVIFKSKAAEYGTALRRGVPVGEQYLREKAASIIDEELGLNLVPPTEIITHNGEIGSAQLFAQGGQVPGLMKFADKVRAANAVPMAVRHDWQMLDDLLMHQDRHSSNVILIPRAGGPTDVALIDNGLSLPENSGQYNGGKRYNSAGLDGEPILQAQKDKLIDFLAREQDIAQRLHGLISPKAVTVLFDNARTLLQRGTYGTSDYSKGQVFH